MKKLYNKAENKKKL